MVVDTIVIKESGRTFEPDFLDLEYVCATNPWICRKVDRANCSCDEWKRWISQEMNVVACSDYQIKLLISHHRYVKMPTLSRAREREKKSTDDISWISESINITDRDIVRSTRVFKEKSVILGILRNNSDLFLLLFLMIIGILLSFARDSLETENDVFFPSLPADRSKWSAVKILSRCVDRVKFDVIEHINSRGKQCAENYLSCYRRFSVCIRTRRHSDDRTAVKRRRRALVRWKASSTDRFLINGFPRWSKTDSLFSFCQGCSSSLDTHLVE